MKNEVHNLPYKIISVVQDNIRYLLENPKQLAWCLLCYDLMHLAVRKSTSIYTNNPKYIFTDNPEKDWPGLNENELDLLYEAWGVTVSNDIPRDRCGKLAPKPNMTLDEWVTLKSDPDYIYNSCRNKNQIADCILCNAGSGMDWNKDGYIVEGHDGFDESIFYGYSQAENEVPLKIRRKIKRICNDRRIRLWFENLYQSAVEFNQLTNIQKNKVTTYLLLSRNRELFKRPGYLLKIIRDAKNNIFQENILDELNKINKIFEKNRKEFEESPAPKSEKIIAMEEGRLLYPFSEKSSPIGNIPDNAHSSYIEAAIVIAKRVLSGNVVISGDGLEVLPVTEEMKRISKNIIEKWEQRGY